MSSRQKLPIGIQTFAKIREDDCYYVGKTPFMLRLIDQGSHYFLSRPRRFGKCLLLDTIAELFEGNRALFEGLYAQERWDWSRRFPVIRISFGKGVLQGRGYADKYRARGEPIHLIGVEFSREQRSVVAFEVETLAAVA